MPITTVCPPPTLKDQEAVQKPQTSWGEEVLGYFPVIPRRKCLSFKGNFPKKEFSQTNFI